MEEWQPSDDNDMLVSLIKHNLLNMQCSNGHF